VLFVMPSMRAPVFALESCHYNAFTNKIDVQFTPASFRCLPPLYHRGQWACTIIVSRMSPGGETWSYKERGCANYDV